MTSRRNQFHFTETLYLCLRSLRGACIVTADSWANSPKGGDAKPPVYGTSVPTTAGLPVRTLAHSDCAGHAPLAGVMLRPTQSRTASGLTPVCGGAASSCRALGQGRIVFVFPQR